MASLLVVFDVVISYPKHPETNTNLALLDVGGGHFSRIEYASAGWLPGSLLTQFSQIAREYVSRGKTNDGSSVPALDSELGATSGPLLQPAFDTVPVSNGSLWKMMIVWCFGWLRNVAQITSGDQEFPLSDMLYFPTGDDPSQFGDGLLTGTDLMELFHSSIPWDYRLDE